MALRSYNIFSLIADKPTDTKYDDMTKTLRELVNPLEKLKTFEFIF